MGIEKPRKVQEARLEYNYESLSKMGHAGATKAAEKRRMEREQREKEEEKKKKEEKRRTAMYMKGMEENRLQAHEDIVPIDGEE
jgi:hypothetical protein